MTLGDMATDPPALRALVAGPKDRPFCSAGARPAPVRA